MFKQGIGSPRLKPAADQQEVSILSPRNFIRLISNSFGQFKDNLNAPNHNNYQQFVATFGPYLQTFQEQLKKYYKSKSKKDNSNARNEQLQLQLKINRIPTIFFVQPEQFTLQLYRRGQGKKKQDELGEYLDQIQLVLFTKSGKYPQKSNIILQNMVDLQNQTDGSLQKVITFRKQLKDKLSNISHKQLAVKNTQRKIDRINKTLQYLQLMKKIKSLKDLSSVAMSKKQNINEQLLLIIKKTQIDQCSRLFSLKLIIKNVQNYRKLVKQQLYKQFLSQIQLIISKLLKYNKQEWKNINVPQSIFIGQNSNQNISQNNITVLDQSYFAFETNHINIINQKTGYKQASTIQQQNQNQNGESLDLLKISKLWMLIKQFDLYDEEQVNEQFMKILVKHNIAFNYDMQEYITYLYNSFVKQKNTASSILKGPQTYASLKNKLAQKQDPKNTVGEVETVVSLELSQQKISFIDMKLYIKIVKFYFGLLRKVLSFISISKDLDFLSNLRVKFAEFLQGNITYFMNLKKILHDLAVDDFFTYLQIINFWENQQFDEMAQFCQTTKNSKVQQYLTNIQKNLLIRQIKRNIEQSTYTPINVSSDNYMTFHHILLPSVIPGFQSDDINMSMTLQLEQNRLQEVQKGGDVTLRLINKNIIYKQKIYKICDSFLELAKSIQKYVKLKENLPEFQQNIQEKICQLIGFYAWYNQKNLTNTKAGSKTLKNYCTFYSTLLLLKQVIQSLSLTNKKLQKTRVQLNDCEVQISKSISMTPFMMIQQKISQLYQSKISTRTQVPTPESQRIIQILKISTDCLQEYFPIEYQQKLQESCIVRFLQTSIKLIRKNYFGYLVNMEKRGIAEIRWFVPKLRQIVEVTVVRDNNLVDKKGNLVFSEGRSTFCVFGQQIQEMQRVIRQKTGTK